MEENSEEDIVSFTPIELIRLRAGMYIGYTGPRGVNHFLYELIGNSIDQFLMGNATEIVVETAPDWFSVWDDGPGLPIEPDGLARKYLTEGHVSATVDNHLPHIHLGTNGLGLVIVNALSKKLVIEAVRGNAVWRLEGAQGVLGESEQGGTLEKGTKLTMWPDEDVLQATAPDSAVLRRVIFDAIHLFPGLKIRLDQEVFYAPGGLADLARFRAARLYGGEIRVLKVRERREGIRVEVALAGAESAREREPRVVQSWVNGTMTEDHGTHVDGVMEALQESAWKPDTILVHVVTDSPVFESRTKSVLGSTEVTRVVRELVSEALAQHS